MSYSVIFSNTCLCFCLFFYLTEKYYVKFKCCISVSNLYTCINNKKNKNNKKRKLNSAAVCFGVRDAQFGRFEVEVGGSLDAVKLVHLSGLPNCDIYTIGISSKWGCRPDSKNVQVVITNTSNTVLLPFGVNSGYAIPGYGPNSSEIVLSDFANPLHLSSGQVLRLWHLHALNNYEPHKNRGKSCANDRAQKPLIG